MHNKREDDYAGSCNPNKLHLPKDIVFNLFLPAKPRSVNVAAQTPANIKLFILGRTSRGEAGAAVEQV